MSVTRRTSEEILHNVRAALNRPEEDDFFQWPEEYYEALNKAHRHCYRMLAQAAPNVLITETTKTTADSGLTYDLGDFHFGDIEVYEPPGPPTGSRIFPANPSSGYFGFWIDGTDLRFTTQTVYSPLYIRWTPETVTKIVPKATHVLPAYCEDWLEYETTGRMASKTGFAGNPDRFHALATAEWSGDPRSPGDMGILGTVKRLAANEGIQFASGVGSRPWYRGIGG